MPQYSQAARPLKVETALGADALLLTGFSGEEGISIPYSYTLDLASRDASVDVEGLLRSPAAIKLPLPDETERIVHGRFSKFVQRGQADDLTFYRAELVPWLWFLSLSTDCRIFQEMTVPEIVEQVFRDQGYSDFTFKCVRSYPQREYCVQYRETHLNFISRLLEEEGIFYFFEHSADKHLLVLADDNTAIKPCPGQASARVVAMAGAQQEEDVVTSVEREHAVYPGRVALADYDYLQPRLRLESSAAGNGREELYEYPARFSQLQDGERLARTRLEEQEAWQQVVRGEGSCRAFQSGYRFELKEHYRRDANQAYALVRVYHHASVGGFRAGADADLDYRNEFVAIPFQLPFRPPRITRKPVVQGSQTAVVVGKAGEEIWVDEHGRVKVQFFWDRLGRGDENSSCWVRVASTWSGKGWGFVSTPRIGQEVLIDFLEGDPDRPIITGQVYNADQTLPFGNAGSPTQSGIKSRSSKGGSSGNFNEIRLEDAKGSEVFAMRAEKDQQIQVNNDRAKNVGHDEQHQVGNDRSRSVGNNESVTIGKDQSVTIGNNRTEAVTADEQVTIGSNRTKSVGSNDSLSVGANQRVRVGGNRTAGVSGNEVVNVAKSRRSMIGMSEQAVVGMARTVTIGMADALAVGVDYHMVAGRQASFTVGKSSIVLNMDGTITIKGKNIKIEGSENVDVKADSTVALKGKTITQN